MRVLLDCRMATWTGVGRYTRGLARALGERSDVSLVELLAPGEAAISPTAEVRECAGHPFSLGGARAFAAVAREVGADVVHCPHFPIPLPAVHPLVVTVHDFIPLAVPGVMPSGMRRLGYRLMLRRAIRAADRIITLSEFSAQATRAFYAPTGGHISVTPAAADDFARGHVGSLPPSLAGVGRFVLGLGNARPHKGLDVLVRAWASIESDAPADVWLALTGDEPLGFVRSAIGSGRPPERIAWLGRVDDDSLRALYAGAAAFVFPSTHEGFGLPPLEAMAFGTPVVCSDATSLPEVVDDAAVLVPAGDSSATAEAVLRVISDEHVARDYAERGRARAVGFTWARTAELTVAAYHAAAVRR
jgi:alpha-1,3-rhamnosyl/mannosyltransferase